MKKCVYIFRGSPLTGKSTLAPKFCKLVPAPSALIEHDMLRWGIHLGPRNITDVTSSEHRFAFENLRLLLEQYLKRGQHTIVIEGLFTYDDTESDQGDVESLRYLAEKYGYECKSIVLTADRSALEERNAKRKQSVPDDEFETLFSNIYKKIDLSEITVDTTHKTVEETLEDLKEYI